MRLFVKAIRSSRTYVGTGRRCGVSMGFHGSVGAWLAWRLQDYDEVLEGAQEGACHKPTGGGKPLFLKHELDMWTM